MSVGIYAVRPIDHLDQDLVRLGIGGQEGEPFPTRSPDGGWRWRSVLRRRERRQAYPPGPLNIGATSQDSSGIPAVRRPAMRHGPSNIVPALPFVNISTGMPVSPVGSVM